MAAMLQKSRQLFQIKSTWCVHSTVKYAKPAVTSLGKKAGKGGKAAPVAEKRVLPVETDAEKLVNYVCGSNIMKTGEDIKLKPDSEYPEWLWNLRLGDPPALEDMDKESLQYWLRLRKLNLQRNVKLLKLKKF